MNVSKLIFIHVLCQVTAVDVDDGKNGDVRYSIIDGSDQKFVINHITGAISVRTLTHRDQNKVFTLMVEAQDKGLTSNTLHWPLSV